VIPYDDRERSGEGSVACDVPELKLDAVVPVGDHVGVQVEVEAT
jgi:hypothetical protein